MKRIKIRLSHIEQDKNLEVWEAVREEGQTPLFFYRSTESDHVWYKYGGSCQNSQVETDIEFIVCDNAWNELFHDGNGARNSQSPSLHQLYRKTWEEIKAHFPNVVKEQFADWILSKATEIMDDTDEANWITIWHKDVRHQIIRRFQFLRQDYAIYRVTRKHTKCEIYWNEYFAAPVNKENWQDWPMWYGTEFSDELSVKLAAKDKTRYVLDPYDFTGRIVAAMSDGIHSDNGGKTLEELRRKENSCMLHAVTDEELDLLLERWEAYLQGPFIEITKEQYWNWLECLPPMRHRNSSFFLCEAYTGSLHQFCFKHKERYFSALRSKRLTNAELDSQIETFIRKLKTKSVL